MNIRAPAKLNLSLRILGQRSDGYHRLQSLVAFMDLADDVHIAPANEVSLTVQGPYGDGLSTTDNLVLRAARALDATKTAHITLTKNIPIGAGLGGGSADAAATLKALNLFWQLGKSDAELANIASTLGSDIVACLKSTPLWMLETGNHLEDVTLELPWHVLLAYPNQVLSAARVYQEYASLQPPPLAGEVTSALPSALNALELLHYLHENGNDLTAAACAPVPEITTLLAAMEALPNQQLVRMTGSGSACFALFDTRDQALAAQGILQQNFPDYFVAAHRFV